MEYAIALTWIRSHLLLIVTVVVTLIFIYHFATERNQAGRLIKKYRNSIFEAQSQIFLTATQHLIAGKKDLAIKEFLNAVDINTNTYELYFTIGELFRSNGEIEKAIGTHRSLIAREDISESTRLKALKELAIDFDKGGFLDKAISTYKDVLKINRDQYEVIEALCRIYEDTEDWDEAYKYRSMLSKVSHDSQSETISHILVQKAAKFLDAGEYKNCAEDLDDAFRFAPSVSAKILKIKLMLIQNDLESAKIALLDLLKERPLFATFVFQTLNEFRGDKNKKESYEQELEKLKLFFLHNEDAEIKSNNSLALSQVQLYKRDGHTEKALDIVSDLVGSRKSTPQGLQIEHIQLLIENDHKKEALAATSNLLKSLNKSNTRHFCSQCGYDSDAIFWRCPQCHEWETIQSRWKT